MQTVPKIDFNPFAGFYLDLDGVFADFNSGFYKLAKKWPHEVTTGFMWKVINSHEQFFASLELMPDAEHLWEYSRQFNPTFLTGKPSKATGKEQKEGWVREKFGPEWTTIVLPKKEKQLHSGPGKVLIDDTSANVEQWISKGGFGVLHGDVWDTIAKIEELRQGYKPV